MSESEPSLHGASYTIDVVARITHIPEDEIVVYYRSGFVTPIEAHDEKRLVFDERAVLQLRRIAFLLSEYQINREGLKMVAGLLDEVERLREEVRFLRER
jgi:DNA-binding transcriptional MerR regulator